MQSLLHIHAQTHIKICMQDLDLQDMTLHKRLGFVRHDCEHPLLHFMGENPAPGTPQLLNRGSLPQVPLHTALCAAAGAGHSHK